MAAKVLATSFVVVLGVVGILGAKFMKRKWNNPHRPNLVVFLDTVCELFMFLRVGPWSTPPEIEAAMRRAMKETGLSDWGSTSFDFFYRYSATVHTERLE